jgi:hypothetical protein
MAQSKPERIDELAGTGSLLIEGRATPVKYTVWIFQEMLEVGPGKTIPGLKSANGKFEDLKAIDAVRAVGRNGQLTLQDGRTCDVILTGTDGAFLVSGQIG